MSSSAQPGTAGKPESSARSYKDTLNLPKTAFAMKANLVQSEPASMKRWQTMHLYERIRAARAGRARFVFHDGPPYANANIHLGHLLNKTLKDFVVRSRTMMGLDCAYVPGWDCHGLPIEHKVMSDLVESGKAEKLRTLTLEQSRMAVRRECQKHAEKQVRLQAAQLQRLLTMADYEHPYVTMSPDYEAGVLEVLAGLVEQGLVFRALKPVHWSIANETALAEAELEYLDRDDPAVYVDFEAADAEAVYDAFGLPPHADDDVDEEIPRQGAGTAPASAGPLRRPRQTPCFMIWTTTPWTLPANLGIAVHPRHEYALVKVDGNVTVIAAGLVERVTKEAGAESVEVLARAPGSRLVGLRYRHPFAEAIPPCGLGRPCDPMKAWSVVPAEYVAEDDGTGLVHTAPGHGEEDFQTGLREGLAVYCPVKDDGTYDQSVPSWLAGLSIWKANELVVKTLRESGHLFHESTLRHSYPHDWRGKSPVIFRCTEQWFVGVDTPTERTGRTLRQMALAAVAPAEGEGRVPDVTFVPDWGRNRMRGMLESRPDWCISRQRSWGLPIPCFYAPEGGVLMTAAVVRAVAAVIREKGSDAWFTLPAPDLLQHYNAGADPDAPAWIRQTDAGTLRKGPDILDVWFESGSSWHSVMRQRSDGRDFPCDLYLEGSDQHRGWFQTSLLPSLGVTGQSPYRTVVTNGFIVDKDGRKMSKSIGNTMEVDDLLKDYGADVCRWWVASLAFENDVKADRSFFDTAGESYRKVRNTLRFMLSNLAGYAPGGAPAPEDFPPASLDAWVLSEYGRLAHDVVAAFERYDFRTAHTRLFDFCNDTLSAQYLSAVKDRLYCDAPDSPRRRRTQAALWTLTDGLCRLLAPIMPHTADEAYRALYSATPDDTTRCVHAEEFIRAAGVRADPAWAGLLKALEPARRALEEAKAGMGLKDPLDAGVVLPDADGVLARFDPTDLADLLGVSRAAVSRDCKSIHINDLRSEPQCERSWKRDGTVHARADGGVLSDRDARALGL